MFRCLFAFLLLAVNTLSAAADFRLALPANQGLVFVVPDDWWGQAKPTMPGQPETGRLTASDPRQFQMLISAVLSRDPSKPPKTRDAIRIDVQSALTQVASQAVEKQIAIQNLDIPGVQGYYFFATDKAPKPDEYKYIMQGQFVIKDLTVVFTALMNGDPKTQTAAVLTALRSARRQ